MADDMNYAEASRVLEAVRVLEELEKAGTINRTELAALNRYRQKTKTAEQSKLETVATYRGVAQGASLGARDEAAGALSALRGEGYAAGRDASRAKDDAARLLAPEQFAKGELVGGVGAAAIPIGLGAGLMAKAPMAARIAVGAATGGLLAAVPDFMRGEGGFLNRVQNINPWMTGLGTAIGAAGPIAGEMGAGAIQAVRRAGSKLPGYGSKSTNVMSRALDRSASAGEDIEAYLRSIGDEGMMADIPGPPRSTAQGLATMGGGGATVLNRELTQRADGAGERIAAEIDRVAGGPNRAFEEARARAAERSSIYGPLYDAAKASPDPIDVRDITSALTLLRANATGKTRAKIDELISEMTSKDGTISAEKLHNLRSDISDTLAEAARAGAGGFVGNLKPILDGIDAKLDDIPGYAAARGGWADTKALDRAAESGRKDVLTGGPTTVETPAQFEARFARLTEAEQEAMRAGVREYIAALMGTSTNDAAAAWRQLSEKGFNEAKLRTLFGQEVADSIVARLRGEKTYAETRGAVLSGSQTEFRKQAAEDLGDIREPDTMQRPGPVSRVKQAVWNDPVNNVIDALVYGSGRSKANEEVGRLLTLQGRERDAAARALLAEAQRLKAGTTAQTMVRALADFMLRTAGAGYVQQQATEGR